MKAIAGKILEQWLFIWYTLDSVDSTNFDKGEQEI